MKKITNTLLALCLAVLMHVPLHAQEIWSVRHIVDNDDIIFGINQATAPTGVGAPRDNRAVALSADGKFLYLGYNNPSAYRVVRRIDLSEADPANNHTGIVNQLIFPTGGAPPKVAKAIATDDKGRVYIALGATIEVYSADLSTLLHTISDFTLCEGVAVKREGATLAVYATDRTDGTLERFVITEGVGDAISSSAKAGLDGDGEVTVTGNMSLRGVDVAPDGTVWIADTNADKVFRVTSSGGMGSSIAVTDAIDVAIDAVKGEVYVSQFTLRAITVLNLTDGSFNRLVTPPFVTLELSATGESGNGAISGMDVAPGHSLYVVNETGNSIQTGAPLDSPFSNTDDDQAFLGDDNDPILQVQFITPLIAHAGSDKKICLGESVILGESPAATGGLPPYKFSWTPAIPLNDASLENPTATPTTTTTFMLSVEDDLGTVATDEVTITVNKAALLYCVSDEDPQQLTSVRLDVMPPAKNVIVDKIIYGGGVPVSGFKTDKPVKDETEAAAYDANTKTAYIISNRGKVSTLLRLDLKTGIAYSIGNTHTNSGQAIDDINALAFNNKTNVLYGVTVNGDRLLKISTTNARVTMVYPNPITTKRGVDLEGASFDETVDPPVLYVISEHGEGEIFTVNLTTGVGTLVGKTKRGMESIGFGKDGVIYATNHDGNFYTLDRTTYKATLFLVNKKIDGEGIIIEECVEALPKANPREDTPREDDTSKIESDENPSPPAEFVLHQNYPNPFNPSTMISFSLPEAGKVAVNIYNATGQLVRNLVDREMAAGRQTLRWNGRDQSGKAVAAGVYLYRIVVQGQDGSPAFTQTLRMTLLK